MSTKLFYVDSHDDNGDSVSAVVEATDANDAVNQWHKWLQSFDPDSYGSAEPTPPRQVFELPEKTGQSCCFYWHVPGGVIEHEI